MARNNRMDFDALQAADYFKSNGQAARFARQIDQFPNALGWDESSGGFIARHRRHSMAGLQEELPSALILKALGFSIVLLEEIKHISCPDARIGDWIFEIKRISRTKRLQTAILHQFRTAYRKCPNLLLHIDQPVREESLRTCLFIATQRYSAIKLV